MNLEQKMIVLKKPMRMFNLSFLRKIDKRNWNKKEFRVCSANQNQPKICNIVLMNHFLRSKSLKVNVIFIKNSMLNLDANFARELIQNFNSAVLEESFHIKQTNQKPLKHVAQNSRNNLKQFLFLQRSHKQNKQQVQNNFMPKELSNQKLKSDN